jgi:hypothetical protein
MLNGNSFNFVLNIGVLSIIKDFELWASFVIFFLRELIVPTRPSFLP